MASSDNAHAMLFRQYTTYQDYGNTMETEQKYKMPEKQKYVRHIVYEPIKHTETMRPFKKPLAFNVYHHVKGKEGAPPQKIKKEDLRELNNEEVIRTRPRVIMTPQASLDDITDPKLRETLIKGTYISCAHRDAWQCKTDDNIAPLIENPTAANSIFLPPFREPKVSPEWRMESVGWDRSQLRSFIDADREFWKQRNLYKNCIPCKETAQLAQIERMKRRLHK